MMVKASPNVTLMAVMFCCTRLVSPLRLISWVKARKTSGSVGSLAIRAPYLINHCSL